MAVISISWIQGVVRIASATPGKISRAAEAPIQVATPAEFLPVLNQLLTGTRVSGTEVVISTDNAVINPLVEETPPANPKVTAGLLARRVEKAKPFPEPSLFGFSRTNPAAKTGAASFLVTATPEKFVREIDELITGQGLDFIGFYPAALCLRPILRSLPAPPEQIVLLMADAETGLMQVIGRSNGQVLFYRTLGASEGRGAEGIQREVRRTLLFAEQKLNTKVGVIFSAGARAALALEGLSVADNLLVQSAPLSADPAMYLRGATALKPSSTENIVPQRISQRGRLRRLRLAINLALAGLLAWAVADTVQTQVKRHLLVTDLSNLGGEIQRRQAELSAVKTDLAAVSGWQETLRIYGEETKQPAVEILLHSLDSFVPAGCPLNRCRIALDMEAAQKGQGSYVVEMEGIAPEGVTVLPLVNRIVELLDKSGWRLEVNRKTGDVAPDGQSLPDRLNKPGAFYVYGRLP